MEQKTLEHEKNHRTLRIKILNKFSKAKSFFLMVQRISGK